MAPTAKARAAFAAELRRLRERSHRGRPDVVAALKKRLPGLKLTQNAMVHWESGANAPRTADIVWALEDELGAEPGSLSLLLGWGRRPREQELDEVHRRAEEITAEIDERMAELERLRQRAEELGRQADDR